MKKPFQSLLLALTLVFSAALTIGLTYAPCYASLCSESFLPYETRLHIATFYCILASVGCALSLRAALSPVRRLTTFRLTSQEAPVLDRRLTAGGVAVTLWILGLTLATTAFWVNSELEYWGLRTDPLDWARAKVRLAVTGVIGHHADILLGLVLIPVSRNSLIGNVFELHQSTLLFAHKLIAYALVVVAFAHGAAYYTFVGEYAHAPGPSKHAFNIDNPTQTLDDAEAGSGWYYATLPSGMISFLLLLALAVTSLPILRRRSYNTFYYTHIICSAALFLAASVHASTDFYMLLPGLLLWIADWVWRLFRGANGGLSRSCSNAVLENAGDGWYRLLLPAVSTDVEKQQPRRATNGHPVQSYYLTIPGASRCQNHAFTAAATATVAEVGGADPGVFLFRRAVSGSKSQSKLDKEWTWKLSALVPHAGDRRANLKVRAEGPYVPATAGDACLGEAAHIICIVGGTGVTGALALAKWWLRRHNSVEMPPASMFSLIWTVRDREVARLREWRELEESALSVPSLRLRLHVSSEAGRLDAKRVLSEEFETANGVIQSARPTKNADGGNALGYSRRAWIYVSGPDGLLRAAEYACIEAERNIKTAARAGHCHGVDGLDWYIARWEV